MSKKPDFKTMIEHFVKGHHDLSETKFWEMMAKYKECFSGKHPKNPEEVSKVIIKETRVTRLQAQSFANWILWANKLSKT
jgi:hypothetical protein